MEVLGDFLSHGKVQMRYRLKKKKGQRSEGIATKKIPTSKNL
jgi:hypothetical protein